MPDLQDVLLIIKKIVVGIIIAAIPTLILLGGLWLTQQTLSAFHSSKVQKPIEVK